MDEQLKNVINERISASKIDGSGFGHRFSQRELATVFGRNDNVDEHKEICLDCKNVFGDDFYFVMPPEYLVFDSPIKTERVAQIVIEAVWNAIDQKRKVGVNKVFEKNEFYAILGYQDTSKMPIELMLFENYVDSLDPMAKFVRHAQTGDVLYSTNEFNECYKYFTYAGLSPKIVSEAWGKVCELKSGNVVKFRKNELGYTEAAELLNHRTRLYQETEPAYSTDEFFKIMPVEWTNELSPNFDYEESSRFFSKIIYCSECCVKFAPYVVKCDKNIFKQNVAKFGAQAVEEMIKSVANDEAVLEKIKQINENLVRLGRCSLETIQSPSDPSRVIVKPTIFDDVDLFKTFFSPTDRDEKTEKLVISILNHSKKFCEDIGAMANAIGVTTRAIEYIAERILPDKIILFSIIKRYEEEIKNQREIAISPKLLAFSDNIACEADMKLIIKALNEFSKLDDCDDEMRNAVIAKVDELLMKK